MTERDAIIKVLCDYELFDSVMKLASVDPGEPDEEALRQYMIAAIQPRCVHLARDSKARFLYSSAIADILNAAIDKLCPDAKKKPVKKTGRPTKASVAAQEQAQAQKREQKQEQEEKPAPATPKPAFVPAHERVAPPKHKRRAALEAAVAAADAAAEPEPERVQNLEDASPGVQRAMAVSIKHWVDEGSIPKSVLEGERLVALRKWLRNL